AIGVEDDRRALRLEPREDALENACAADAQARLVAAAHAARQAAGEHEAENRRHHSRPRVGPPCRATGAHAPGARIRRASIIVYRGLAPVPGALFLDVLEILIEHDALLSGECDEALAARATDEREIRLAGELHAPGGEARARDEDRDAHAHGLDHHFRGEPACGVENLVVRGNAMLEHPSCDLV